MPYKCGFGCTSYNPMCDGCDAATTGDNPYDVKEDEELFEAAKKGMTREEWLQEDEDDF